MFLCLFLASTIHALPLDDNFEFANGDTVEDSAELSFLKGGNFSPSTENATIAIEINKKFRFCCKDKRTWIHADHVSKKLSFLQLAQVSDN